MNDKTEQFESQEDFSVEESFDDNEFQNESPAIAESGTKNMAVLVVIGVLVVVIIFIIFSGGEEENKEVEVVNINNSAAQDAGAQAPAPPPPAPIEVNIPAPPPPPPPPAPKPVAAPPPLPSPSSRGRATARWSGGSRGGLKAKDVEERIKSGIFVSGGGNGPAGGLFDSYGSRGYTQNLSDSVAAKIDATISGDPRYIIGMGKIIDAVLETGINTLLPGLLRAVVSQDVYAEQGRAILIPKGSRLIGLYNTEISRGQARVFITWNRVIRPDGVDIIIGSPSADLLGRAGITGNVDNKYLEIFSSSILLSSLSVGFAAIGEGIGVGGQINEGQTGRGDSTRSGRVKDLAMLQAIEDFGSTTGRIAKDLTGLRPTISVEQGTRIKVFVNKDIKFPKNFSSSVRIIR